MTNNITLPRATVQQALEALEEFCESGTMLRPIERREALRTALEQQQAEPVAEKFEAMHANGNIWITTIAAAAVVRNTTPPQRQWVGLTDEDVNRESAPIAQQKKLAFHAGMYVAQKILKEKNSD